MKTLIFQFVLLVAITTVSLAAPLKNDKAITLTRLNEVDAFPEQYRKAVCAVSAALLTDGAKPSEYFAEISPQKDGLLKIYLRHQSHSTDRPGELGDACNRCRSATFDSKTGKASKISGIR